MMESADLPIVKELMSIQLDNESRTYFGMDPISVAWDEVRINAETTLYFDGNRILKVIQHEVGRGEDGSQSLSLCEMDTRIDTDARKLLMPKTQRGKPKRITASNVLAVLPTGCVWNLTLNSQTGKAAVHCWNPRNSQRLSTDGFGPCRNQREFSDSLAEFIRTSPPDHFMRVERMSRIYKRALH